MSDTAVSDALLEPTTLRLPRHEHDLLSVARAALGLAPASSVRALLAREPTAAPPEGLTASAQRALRRTLAIGGITLLVRGGGWRSEPALGQIGPRRLWDRHEPAPLHYTRVSFEVLVALVSTPPTERARPLASGDELVLYAACDLLARAGLEPARLAPWVARSTLARLAFPDALPDEQLALEPARWLARPLLVEALQLDLRRQLLRIEARMTRAREPAELLALARRHEADLSALADACAEAAHPERMTFALEAAQTVVATPLLRAAAQRGGRLADRAAALAASGAVLRVVHALGATYERLRHVGFLDDDYHHAQRVLHRWEPFAPAVFTACQARLAELTALDSVIAPRDDAPRRG